MAATQDRTLGIYIKGVDEETTEEDCTAAFSSFGTITEVVLKGERGWGLVHFTTPAEAAAAAAGGITSVGGVEVEVLARTPPKPREAKAVPATVNIYLKGLEEETTKEDVETALEAFGEVASVKLQAARGFAFAAMETVEAAEAAVAATPLTVGALGDVRSSSQLPSPCPPPCPSPPPSGIDHIHARTHHQPPIADLALALCPRRCVVDPCPCHLCACRWRSRCVARAPPPLATALTSPAPRRSRSPARRGT
jgi:RNA recognition motif-containing protein